jgi:hypothetical protein
MEEGAEKLAKEVILEQGQERFGPPELEMTTRLEGISDLPRLKRIHKCVMQATSWQDVLDTP